MTHNPATNPFINPEGAENWIRTVESGDSFREDFIYPRVQTWIGKLASESTLADVGCGQGKCVEFVPPTMSYFGLDPSPRLIERASELYGGDNRRRFFVGSAEQIDLPDNSVDAALSVHVWFHLAHLDRPSRELGRIVRPGGSLYITTANPKGYETWRSWYDNISEENESMWRGTLVGPDFRIDESEFFTHSLDEIAAALGAAGFRDMQLEDFGRSAQPTALAISATKTLDKV